MNRTHRYKTNKVIYPGDDTAFIELKGGRHVIVDEADASWLTDLAFWRLNGMKRYAVARCRNSNDHVNIFMHRIILNVDNGFYVDHINGNGLDNRRSNLRQCTKSENQWNSRIQSNNTSGFKGVDWSKLKNKWRAKIKVGGVRIELGYFDDIEMASEAVAAARIKLHGEFANHGHGPADQHLVTSHSVHTTYSQPMQENMQDQDQ
jgi:hypothetical protein